MINNSDVLVVGAGTAGTYISWIIAKKGYSVILIEKDKKEDAGKRLDVIHFESDRIEKAGIPYFKIGDPDCIDIRDISYVITPDFKKQLKIRALQTIVRLTPFLNKMYKIIESDGVKILFSCEFKKLIYENGRIVGLVAEKDGESLEFRSRLVVDASGKPAVLRTSLPKNYGVETFKLEPQNVMYVLLQYIKWKDPEGPHPKTDTGYNWWLLWFGPSYDKDGAILGVGQPGSYENAKKAREDFLGRATIPPYEITKEEKGFTPYRRPPYSLISDGFLCIGDAAAITYPFSGHGVTATWILCIIAADIIGNELNIEGYITKERLWDINVKYFRDQGAKFAALLTQLSGVLNFNEKEWNYFLKKGLIYQTGKDDDIPEPNKEYEEKMSVGAMIKFLMKIIWGLMRRKLSLKNMTRLINANGLASKIQKHYERFPEKIEEFEAWVVKAKDLWAQKKVAVKKLSNVSIEYH